MILAEKSENEASTAVTGEEDLGLPETGAVTEAAPIATHRHPTSLRPPKQAKRNLIAMKRAWPSSGRSQRHTRMRFALQIRKHWMAAMKDKLNSLAKMNVYDLIEPEPNHEIMGCFLLYGIKRSENGRIAKLKARLIAQDFHAL